MTETDAKLVGYDARAVANLLLERARSQNIAITNLSLQKLVYFAHGWMLTRYERPLVDGYFEAWQHGPVHPVLYSSFKSFGREPITELAGRLDLRTGEMKALHCPDDAQVAETVDRVLRHLGGLSANRLVNLSHARGGAWHETVNKRPTETRLGLRISDTVVRERFHRHLVMGDAGERIEDVVEETPPA
ncbi:type VI toxin-antitoxin system SocA family antitoxin [Brevundimonas sp.]